MNSKELTKKIVSNFDNRQDFLNLLKVNPGLVIIKFGATWCGPCKQIKHIVDAFFASSPHDVICCDIDVDQSIDLYSFLKRKRMINGIPAILCYKKGNYNYSPDDMVTGSDPVGLDAFFKRCGIHHIQVKRITAKKLHDNNT